MMPALTSVLDLLQIKNDIFSLISLLEKKADIDALITNQLALDEKNRLFVQACVLQLQYLLDLLALENKNIEELEKRLSYSFKTDFAKKLLKECFSAISFTAWPKDNIDELKSSFDAKIAWGMQVHYQFRGMPNVLVEKNNDLPPEPREATGADRWRRQAHKFAIDLGNGRKERERIRTSQSTNLSAYYEDQAEQRERSKIPIYYNMLMSLSSDLNKQLENYKYRDNFFGRLFKIEAANIDKANTLKRRVRAETRLPELPEFYNLSCDTQLERLKEKTDILKQLFANTIVSLEALSSRRLLTGVSAAQTQFCSKLNNLQHVTPENITRNKRLQRS